MYSYHINHKIGLIQRDSVYDVLCGCHRCKREIVIDELVKAVFLQVACLKLLRPPELEALEVGTVDGFQGIVH